MRSEWWVEIRTLVALAVLVSCNGPGDSATGLGPTIDLPPTDLDVVVTSVADGDSFRGDSPSGEIEVRLLGINSPELDECHGQPAMDALRDLIEDRGIRLAVEPEPDQFGRVLARAVVDDRYVNLEMALSGKSLAVSDGGPDATAILEAEQFARTNGLGLWATDVCGALGTPATLEITAINYDPPGADEDESVTITNTGGEAIDLARFVLRDESSVNRLEFPSVLLQPGEDLTVVRGCNSRAGVISWCTEQAVWNNGGDAALLLDPYGRIVALRRY